MCNYNRRDLQELYEALSNDRCKEIIKETEDVILWIKKKLDN